MTSAQVKSISAGLSINVQRALNEMEDRKELRGDRRRLEWLIAGGYTPANWRAWTPADGPASNFPNGQVMVSHGDRATIDKCMFPETEDKEG